ncbi:MAG TPA: NUDIX hydrolase [Acidimicrobiia bacterium]|nr:NUDIX hydrolase [Acidimicrobiia bacterium]
MTGFRVVDSTTRCAASFVSLEELTVAGPDGETFQRTVVRHPGAVVMAPVEDDRVLMVRQWRVAVGRALLELPAGKRDVAGEPPEATAARELEEEIGRRPGQLTLLAEFYNSPGFCDEHSHLFCATDLERLPERRAVSAEERAMTVEAIALDTVPDLIARRELIDAKSIIGLLLTRDHLEGRGGA